MQFLDGPERVEHLAEQHRGLPSVAPEFHTIALDLVGEGLRQEVVKIHPLLDVRGDARAHRGRSVSEDPPNQTVDSVRRPDPMA